jgi:methyl-accepting chemotaxis protein
MVNQLNVSHRTQTRGGEQLLDAATKIEANARDQEASLQKLTGALEILRRSI